MSKLLTFLETNCKLTLENKSGSKYFEYGCNKIRVSDHIAPTSIATMINTIQILLPKNSRKHYILILKGEIHIYESFTKIKIFLENMFLFINSIDTSTKVKENKSNKELRRKLITSNEEINKLKATSINIRDFSAGQQKQINIWRNQKC